MDNEYIDNELVILSKQTLDLFLKEKNCADIIAVYTFYYYTAKWQKTNQIKAVDAYVMKGLHMGSVSFHRAKAFLKNHGLIESVPNVSKGGKIKGWYVKIKYIWSNQKVQNEVKIEKPEVLITTSGEKETNALSANSLNALNANNIPPLLKSNLPENRGKTPILRVLSVYRDLYNHLYGIYPVIEYKRTGSMVKRLLERYTEIQVAAMMIAFFNWSGMDGSDDYERKRLVNATHPLGWFYQGVNRYEIYLRNVYKLEFDDEDKVRSFVATHMISLNDTTR